MAQTEFECSDCNETWFDNKPYEYCPFCGCGNVAWWTDEYKDEDVKEEEA